TNLPVTLRGRFPNQMFIRSGKKFPVNSFGIITGFIMPILFKLSAYTRAFTGVNSQHKLIADQFSGKLQIFEPDQIGRQ
ncbi:hypothetical protein NL488_27930, partial [Klebsiella pneumoniae]|nr:hypothetical protein [Klebsiella pneumoniae]